MQGAGRTMVPVGASTPPLYLTSLEITPEMFTSEKTCVSGSNTPTPSCRSDKIGLLSTGKIRYGGIRPSHQKSSCQMLTSEKACVLGSNTPTPPCMCLTITWVWV